MRHRLRSDWRRGAGRHRSVAALEVWWQEEQAVEVGVERERALEVGGVEEQVVVVGCEEEPAREVG